MSGLWRCKTMLNKAPTRPGTVLLKTRLFPAIWVENQSDQLVSSLKQDVKHVLLIWQAVEMMVAKIWTPHLFIVTSYLFWEYTGAEHFLFWGHILGFETVTFTHQLSLQSRYTSHPLHYSSLRTFQIKNFKISTISSGMMCYKHSTAQIYSFKEIHEF